MKRLVALSIFLVYISTQLSEDAANFRFDIEAEIFRGGPFDPLPANCKLILQEEHLDFL